MRGRSADRVRLRVSGLITLLIALVAGLAVMVGGLSPANAATAPVSAKAPAAPAAQAAPATKAPSATKTARKGALSPGAERELRSQAARGAIAASTVPDTCAGTIQPDTIYPCTTPSSAGTDTFTLTLTTSTDILFIRVLPADDFSGQSLPVTVTGPGNSAVTCQEPTQLYECATSEAGTYTVAVQNEGSDYTIDYTALLSDASCAAVNPSFAAPAIQGTDAAGATGTCYSLNMPSGHVLHVNSTTTPNAIMVAVYDDTGTQVCVEDQGDCTLTGPAPYRVFVSSPFGEAEKYTVQLNDITDPAGCVAVVVQETYGNAPATSTDRCRTLKVTTAGSYQVSAGDFPGTLYTAAGTSACSISPQGPDCQLAAGTYNLVFDDFPPLTSFPVEFIAADEKTGCVAANDTDFATGPATGSFKGVGEEICLTLPTPAGKSDYFFEQPVSATAPEPGVQVVDATGAQECASANGDFTYATCALSGQAPFRVILSAAAQADAYRFLVQRTDSTTGCVTWPRSGFGGSAGATVTLTASSDVKCLTIPAAQHSTGEMIDYSNAANTTDGAVYVNDPTGKNVCTGASLSFCSYQVGVTYTALVVTTAAKGDTYDLVRRDVSKSATCGAPKSTTVGGPSTSLTLTSDLDMACYRVTAPAADKLWFSARSLAPTAPGAQSAAKAALEVTNAAGSLLCNGLVSLGCTATGSTDYQVMVTADGYAGVAITTHLDTWVVGTASGWAPQCTAHQFSAADGWGPLSGTLTENAAGYCAVVNINALQDWNIAGTDTAGSPQSLTANIYTAASWGNIANLGLCDEDNVGQFGFSCQTSPSQQASAALLLVSLNTAQSPTGYTMQGVCTLTCAHSPQTATIRALSPTSGAAGPGHTVTVTGTGLNLDTVLTLAHDANTAATGTTQSVNAAGTSMTVLVNTAGVAPGTYDVVLDTPGYTVSVPSPGYDPGAYKVTTGPAAPSPSGFVPVNATRILDTATGTGAPKAEVAAQGTLTLTVAGKGGVPAKGVAAVALDVTAAGPAKTGSLVVYPDGVVRPNVTDLNFAAGQTATNLAVVPMSDGKVRIYNDSTGKLNLTADVIGYYTSSAGTRLTTVAPKRILDTRNGTGARKARVAARGTVTLTVAGADGVPAKGVSAVALDVTAIGPTKSGSLVVYPDGAARPGTTDLSFTAGKSMTELVVVPVRDGKVAIYNDSAGQLDLTADVEGYYAAAGGRFVGLGPVRVLDTRSGLGGSGETVLPHAAAVTQLTDIPNTATSAVLEVTVTGAQQAGTLIAFADGGPLPATQNVLFTAGQTVTDLVVVPVVNGNVDFYNNSPGDLQVVADLEGYYTP